jgi:hypothetical protein
MFLLYVDFTLIYLFSSHSYKGNETVHIGNGTSLSIAHKGTAIIHTPFKSLVLRNVLHVPAITKNLLSISQLILDKNVIVEFSSHSCFIKDQATHRILFHGILHNGHYKITPLSLLLIISTKHFKLHSHLLTYGILDLLIVLAL